jgi:hypothetical protein
MMKSFYGDNATAENQWGYHWLPKWDKSLRGGVIAIKTLHHADEKFVTVLPVINLARQRGRSSSA